MNCPQLGSFQRPGCVSPCLVGRHGQDHNAITAYQVAFEGIAAAYMYTGCQTRLSTVTVVALSATRRVIPSAGATENFQNAH
jgi:hypothetical protein